MDARLTQVFRAALDLEGDARDAYLKLECAGDATLLTQVRTLLSQIAPGTAKAFKLDITSALTPAVPALSTDRGGQTVGAFRLVRVIGSGGMGAVWLAERIDGFEQRVAIKWLHAGLSPSARERFARERETLARLEHPGIARIIDGGRDFDADWYAMELVDGLPLDQFVQRGDLDLHARLRLLVQLCSAVHFAHQHLIVHRDLKPANVLVTPDGTAKLLDFGVAKSLSEGGDLTASQAPMTYAYAAPEQIKNEPITTATDVYALGVILYELLTGERPHKPRGNGSLSLLQAITDTDATSPSSVLRGRPSVKTEQTIRPQTLQGDLDTIALKALSRDPQRRYASAQSMAQDLQRYMANEPISARPDSIRYRVAKFVRRNTLATAIAAVSVLALLMLTALSLAQARRADREAQRSAVSAELARIEARQSEVVTAHLSAVLSRAQAVGATVSTESLLGWAADTELAGRYADPAMQRALQLASSDFLLVANDFPRALEVLNGLAPQMQDASRREQLQAQTNRARALIKLGDLDGAAQALASARLLLPPKPGFFTAQLYIQESELMRARGQLEAAASSASKAAQLADALHDISPLARGQIVGSAAVGLLQSGDLDAAVRMADRAQAIWAEAGISDNPSTLTMQTLPANALFLRGHILQSLARFAAISPQASESVPPRAARATGYAKALVLANQPAQGLKMIAQARSQMCAATGEHGSDCLAITLSAAETALLAGADSERAAYVDLAQKALLAKPSAPLSAALSRLQLRTIAIGQPSAANSQALIKALVQPGLTGSPQRSAVRALLLSAQTLAVSGQDAEAALLATAAIDLARSMPAETGGMDRSLLNIWRARLAKVQVPPADIEALATAVGPTHPWLGALNPQR